MVSTSEAAQILGVSPQTLRGWRSRNLQPLKFFRVGRNCKYAKNDVKNFLQERINIKMERKIKIK